MTTKSSSAPAYITYYEDLEDFFSKNKGGRFFYFSTKGRHTYCDVTYPDNSYLVFGREDAGLPEELLRENEESCLRLPMKSEARSLNLSNAVAVGAFEVLRQWGFPELQNEGKLTRFDW